MLRIVLTTVAVAVIAFTIVGPIGTYITLAPLDRLAFAAANAFFCWPIFYSMSVVTAYFTRRRSPLQIGVIVALVLLVMALPCAAVVFTFQALFYPEHSPPIRFVTIYLVAATATLVCHFVLHYVLCQRVRHTARSRLQSAATEAVPAGEVGGGEVGGIAADPALSRSAEAAPTPAPAGGPPPQETTQPAAAPAAGDAGATLPAQPRTALVDRLLPDPGGEIIFLKAEGRYVEVHTTTGTNRMIARFADIVAQLEGLGIQVHRSYWVSLRYAAELIKRDTHTLVRLNDGREIPVSRTYLAVVRSTIRAAAS